MKKISSSYDSSDLTDSSKPEKKEKSTRAPTEYQKFMKTELSKLKISEPDINHKERFKMAVETWNKLK